MEACMQFWDTVSPVLEDSNHYPRFFGKLIYLTITHPAIVYTINVLSQFM